MNTIFNYNLDLLNCSKEVLFCLEQSTKINYPVKRKDNFVDSTKLCLSLLIYSKPLHHLLDLNIDQINNLKKAYIKNDLTTPNLNVYNICYDIIQAFNILNDSKYFFSTVTLFYYLLNNNYFFLKFIENIIPLHKFKNILEYIENKSHFTTIPDRLKPFLFIEDNNFFEKIIGRKKEINHIISILSDRVINRSIIISGKEGIGKKTIVKTIINKIPSKIFFVIDIFLLKKIKDISLVDQIFEHINCIENSILYIKNIKLLLTNNNLNEIMSYFKTLLFSNIEANRLQIIGITSDTSLKELNNITNLDYLIIEELEIPTIKQILKTHSEKLRIIYNKKDIIILDSVIDTIISLSDKYLKEYCHPQKSMIVLQSILQSIRPKEAITEKIIKENIVKYMPFNSASNMSETYTAQLMENKLRKFVFGQEIAVDKVISSLKRSLTGIKDTTKPIGSFLLCGPSGTGKTELVKSIAEVFSNLPIVRLDMSEYMEKHSVAKLIGCPPGYIGHEEGGILTEAIKVNPHSIVLFDEIEKAHPDINNIMLQLLDDGRLTDSKGTLIDCTNTIIIYTSNLGCPNDPNDFESFKLGIDVSDKEYKMLCSRVDKAVRNFFRPEFLNRLDSIVVFKPLTISNLMLIFDKFIEIIKNRLIKNNIYLDIDISNETKLLMAKLSYHPLYGARPLKRIINQLVEKPISDLLLLYNFNKPHVFSIFLHKENINYMIKSI